MKKYQKNFKKVIAILCTVAMLFSVLSVGFSALAEGAPATSTQTTNGNGGKTDIGAWFVTYNNANMWATNFGTYNPIKYRPLMPDGTYGIPDSANTEVIDFQIKELAKAKVDFVLFDLTNGGLTNDVVYGSTGNKWIVDNAKLTAQRLALWNKNNDWKIKYAVAIGAYWEIRGGDDQGHAELSMGEVIELQAKAVKEQFFDNTVYGGDNYYQLDGKPLLVAYDWAYNAVTSTATSRTGWNNYRGDKTYGNQFTVRAAMNGEAGTYGWKNQEGTQVNSEVELVSPGWGNSAGTAHIDRNDGATYQANWDTVTSNTLPRIVMIASFNDYHEKTAVFTADTTDCDGTIEPKWSSPDKYWNMTKAGIAQVRAINGDFSENKLMGSTITTSPNTDFWRNYGPVERIIDGQYSGYGATIPYSNGSAYFNFAFSEAKTVNKVNITRHGGEGLDSRATDIAVDVKLANGTWKRVAERHGLDVYNTMSYDFYFEKVEATQLRITSVNKRSNQASWFVQEASAVYDPSVLSDQYTGTATDTNAPISFIKSDNFIRTATVSSSNTDTFYNTWPLSRLNDGVSTPDPTVSPYALIPYNASTGIAYYEFTLAQTAKVNKVTVKYNWQNTAKRPEDVVVDVQLPDGTWKRVAEKHAIPKFVAQTAEYYNLDFMFETVEATKIRVSANKKRNSTDEFGVNEIEAYLDENITSASYTGTAQDANATYNIPYITSANYVREATLTSSNTDPFWDTNRPLSRANDGKIAPNPSDAPEAIIPYASNGIGYYTITFSSPKTINKVKVDNNWAEPNNRPQDIAVDVKLANGTWKRVAEMHNIPAFVAGSAEYYNKEFKFEAVETQIIRISANKKRNNSANWSVCELEAFWDGNITPDQYTGTAKDANADYNIPYIVSDNFMSEAVVTASAVDQYMAPFPLSNINDGKNSPDPTVAKAAGLVYDQSTRLGYFEFDFAEQKRINQITLYYNWQQTNIRPQDIAIDIKDADGKWIRVAEKHNIAAFDNTSNPYYNIAFNFAPVDAVKVRVSANGYRNNTANFFLNEVTAVLNENLTSADYTGGVPESNACYNIPFITSDNYALGKAIKSSPVESFYANGYPLSNLNDGVIKCEGQDFNKCGGLGFNQTTGCAFVEFDLAGTFTMNEVRIYFNWNEPDKRPADMAIDVLVNGEWQRVAERHTITSDEHILSFGFNTVEATKFRVIANKNGNANCNNFMAAEICAYYNSYVTKTGIETTDVAARQIALTSIADVNLDCVADANDLTSMTNYILGINTGIPASNYDLNNSGTVDLLDLVKLKKIFAASK